MVDVQRNPEICDSDHNRAEFSTLARIRAAFYSFLSVHFTSLPDAAFVARMREGDLRTMLDALVEYASAAGDISTGARLMLLYLDQTIDEEPSKLAEALGVDRTRLYRGVAPNYGPPPPYEMVWTRRQSEKGISVLENLAGLYRQMGLEPSTEIVERPDYVGVEIDFLCELALREAAAWEEDPDQAVSIRQDQHRFLVEHLGEWLPVFVDEALKWAKTDFYRGHLRLLRDFISCEMQYLA